MGLHIDINRNERSGIIYFQRLYRVLLNLVTNLKSAKLLASIDELYIWNGIPNVSSGGEILIHLPLLSKNIDTAEREIIKQLNIQFSENENFNPNFRFPRNPLISFRIEGELNVQLDDLQTHRIPLEIVSSARMRSFQGDLYLRTYSYHDYEFEDIFLGKENYQKNNWKKLDKVINTLKHHIFARRIIIGDTLDCYKIHPLAYRIYNKDEANFIDNLFRSVSFIRSTRKASPDTEILPELDDEDIDRLTKDIKPYNKDHIISGIMNHDSYKEDLPMYYDQRDILKIEGSIDLYSKDLTSLEDVLGDFLKQISLALKMIIKPRKIFEDDFLKGLNIIKFTEMFKNKLVIDKKKKDEMLVREKREKKFEKWFDESQE